MHVYFMLINAEYYLFIFIYSMLLNMLYYLLIHIYSSKREILSIYTDLFYVIIYRILPTYLFYSSKHGI